MMTSTLANITDEYLIWKASAEILVAIMKLGRVFKNAFGVWPSSGAAIAAPDYEGKPRDIFFSASIAVAEDGHAPYCKDTPWEENHGKLCRWQTIRQGVSLRARHWLTTHVFGRQSNCPLRQFFAISSLDFWTGLD
jgi:hypothetical protein